jgi:hypothetical protein
VRPRAGGPRSHDRPLILKYDLRLGNFKGHAVSLGPVVSYATKIAGKYDLVGEVKWLSELDVDKRLKGNYVWFKLGCCFSGEASGLSRR